MFKKVHIRLTLLCAGITAAIMVVMSFYYLYVSEQNLRENRFQAFFNDMNTIATNLEQQPVISMEWLSKMEASGDYRFYVLDNGVPFLYNQLGGQDDLQSALFSDVMGTYEASWKQLDKARVTCLADDGFVSGGVRYLCGLIRFGKPRSTLEVILLSPLQELEEQIMRQRVNFILIDCAAILALTAFSYVFTGLLLRPIEENQRKQSEFVASASHELRTPLAVILSAAECCRSASQGRQENFLKTIAGEGQRMSALIDEMLMLCQSDAQRMSVRMQETELDTLLIGVYEAFEPLAEKKNIAISLKLPENAVPHCMADPERLKQVLEILLNNAVSYTPEHGDIVLSLRYTPVKLSPNRGHFSISVRDNGVGIPDEDKKRIFDRFYRTEKSRSGKEHFGLGLSVAYELVKAMDGAITVEDAADGGTVFTLTL